MTIIYKTCLQYIAQPSAGVNIIKPGRSGAANNRCFHALPRRSSTNDEEDFICRRVYRCRHHTANGEHTYS